MKIHHVFSPLWANFAFPDPDSESGFTTQVLKNEIKPVTVYFAEDLGQRVRLSGPLQNAQKRPKDKENNKIKERSFVLQQSHQGTPLPAVSVAWTGQWPSVLPTWRKNCVEGERFDWCLARRLPASGHLSTFNFSRFKWPAARELRTK
jgi:hypothetical protein